MMKYRNWSVIVVLLLGVLLAGLSISPWVFDTGQLQAKNVGAITQVTPQEAQALIQQRQGLKVVDVRTLRERERAAIAGSVHVPMRDVMQNKITWPHDQPLLLYCAVGGRSSAAANWLEKQGFSEIYNLDGGIIEWQRQGLPVVKGK